MQMKLKEIGVSVLETTSAGSIASVASSLFTPTSDGQPAVIRRTKKKQNKNPSIYEGDMKTDREAGIKWVDNPDWKRLHEMNLKMVKDFLDHKESVSEQPAQSTKPATQQVAQRAAQLKTIGGGKANAGMVARGLDKASQGGTMPPALVKAIAPYAKAIMNMMADPKLFTRFKALMKLANDADASSGDTSVGRKIDPNVVNAGLGEATMSRQHFEVVADIIGSYPGSTKVRMDFMTHAMAKFREINPQFKDSVFVARVRAAMGDDKKKTPSTWDKVKKIGSKTTTDHYGGGRPPGKIQDSKQLKKAPIGEGDGRKKGIHPKGHPKRKAQQAAIHAEGKK